MASRKPLQQCQPICCNLIVLINVGMTFWSSKTIKKSQTISGPYVYVIPTCIHTTISIASVLCFVNSQFATTDAVMNGAKYVVAMQLSHDPVVRQCVRQIFYERAKISVRPTKKGLKVCDSVLLFHFTNELLVAEFVWFWMHMKWSKIMTKGKSRIILTAFLCMLHDKTMNCQIYMALLNSDLEDMDQRWIHEQFLFYHASIVIILFFVGNWWKSRVLHV